MSTPVPVVTFPDSPLEITNAQEVDAEDIVIAFCQLLQSGSVGASVVTPPILLPDPNNPGSVLPLNMATGSQQLFYKHLALAIAYYVSSAPPPPPAEGAVQEIRFAISTGTTQVSTTIIPAGAVVEWAELDIDVAYDGGTTISVGQPGLPEILAGPLDNLPTTTGRYGLSLDVEWGGTPLPVQVTVAGAPVDGSGFCVVRFSSPTS